MKTPLALFCAALLGLALPATAERVESITPETVEKSFETISTVVLEDIEVKPLR